MPEPWARARSRRWRWTPSPPRKPRRRSFEWERTSWGHPNLEGATTCRARRDGERLTKFYERALEDARNPERSRIFVPKRRKPDVRLHLTGDRRRIPPMNETGLARARPSDRGTYGPGPFNREDMHLTIADTTFAVRQRPPNRAEPGRRCDRIHALRLDGRPHADNIRLLQLDIGTATRGRRNAEPDRDQYPVTASAYATATP